MRIYLYVSMSHFWSKMQLIFNCFEICVTTMKTTNNAMLRIEREKKKCYPWHVVVEREGNNYRINWPELIQSAVTTLMSARKFKVLIFSGMKPKVRPSVPDMKVVRFAATPSLVNEDLTSLLEICNKSMAHQHWAWKNYDPIFPSRDEDIYADLRRRGLKVKNQR